MYDSVNDVCYFVIIILNVTNLLMYIFSLNDLYDVKKTPKKKWKIIYWHTTDDTAKTYEHRGNISQRKSQKFLVDFKENIFEYK